jgi:hypothetical protein
MSKRKAQKISHWEAVKALNLKLATDKEAEEVTSQAEAWQDSGGKCFWDDGASGQRAAIAEYLANQKGLTLFVEKVYPKFELNLQILKNKV